MNLRTSIDMSASERRRQGHFLQLESHVGSTPSSWPDMSAALIEWLAGDSYVFVFGNDLLSYRGSL